MRRFLPAASLSLPSLSCSSLSAGLVKGHAYAYVEKDTVDEGRSLDFRCVQCAVSFTVAWADDDPPPEDAFVSTTWDAVDLCESCDGYASASDVKEQMACARQRYGYQDRLAEAKKAALDEFRTARNMFDCLYRLSTSAHLIAMRKLVDRHAQVLEDVKRYFPPGASKSVVAKATKEGWLFALADVRLSLSLSLSLPLSLFFILRLNRADAVDRTQHVLLDELDAAARRLAAAKFAAARAVRASAAVSLPPPDLKRKGERAEQKRTTGEAAGNGAASGEVERGGARRERETDAASPEQATKRIKVRALPPLSCSSALNVSPSR
mgnify:CR=1 FL=1